MLVVLKEIVPRLPMEEKFDLADQLRRCCKGIPSLIAEGYARRYQRKNWQKYLDECIGEMNEMDHHLNVCIDVYRSYINIDRCNEVKEMYNISAKQTFKLRNSWRNFHENRG